MIVIIFCVPIILLFTSLCYSQHKKIERYEATIEKQSETIKKQHSEIARLKGYNDAYFTAITQIRKEYELYHKLYLKAKEKLEKCEPEESGIKP